MPLYDYKCGKCGAVQENIISSVDDRLTNAPECCETSMGIRIAPVKGYVSMDINYKSIVTGNHITSWKARREEFARENLVDVSDYKTTDWTDEIGKKPLCERPVEGAGDMVSSDMSRLESST